jgi:hypothetical protein
MKQLILIFALILSLGSCTSSHDFERGKKQLEQQGYTDIVNTGYQSFCCGKDDTFSTGFACKNSKGEIVTGCFCSSGVKGVTIRFE